MLSITLSIVVFFAQGAVASENSEAPPRRTEGLPAERIFQQDFELGDLEIADEAVVSEDRFYEGLGWAFSPDHPPFMRPGFRREHRGDGNVRYLIFPLRGAGARLRSEDLMTARERKGPASAGTEDWPPIEPNTRLQIRGEFRWDDQGRGSFGVDLTLGDGTRIPLFKVAGPAGEWQSREIVVDVPRDARSARLELWVQPDPTVVQGEVGIDNLVVDVIPRIVMEWRGTLRRIEPSNDEPIAVSSVGFPEGAYQLEFIVRDPSGREVLRETYPRYVSEGLPIEFLPKLGWARHDVPRGLYRVDMRVRSVDRGWELTDQREFALAGKPPFEADGAVGRWGLILDSSAKPPTWLELAGRARVLFPMLRPGGQAPTRETLPGWTVALGEYRRAGLLRGSDGWTAANVAELSPLFPHIRNWFWQGPPTGTPVLAILEGLKSYLRVGEVLPPGVAGGTGRRPLFQAPTGLRAPSQILAWGQALSRPRGSWSVQIAPEQFPLGQPAPALATALYLLSTFGPETVYVSQPEALLFEPAPQGDLVPTRAFLAWEFVTGFLSSASFSRLENWDPRGICAVFQRDGREYLVVIGDEAHEIELNSGAPSRVFDAIGSPVRLTASDKGICRIPVGPAPLLIEGLDLARVRTFGSLKVSGGDIVRGGQDQALRFELTNAYDRPIQMGLNLDLPDAWEQQLILETRLVAPGETAIWESTVRVPTWYGIEADPRFQGELTLDAGEGPDELAVDLPLPIRSSVLEIEPVELAENRAVVKIKNLTDEALTFMVYLDVRPVGAERRFTGQRLDPGEERNFRIDFATSAGDAEEIGVGAIIESLKTHVNRAFAF